MKDYLITVDGIGISAAPVLGTRTIDKSEDYAEGIVKGLKLAFPNNQVFKEEIPKLKNKE